MTTKRKTNLILIGIDSLRADHMSLYGYRHLTTPHMDKFAARGAVLTAAEALVLDAAPIIPIYFNTHVYLLHPAVHGWQPTPMDHSDYRYVWLEK